MNVIQQRPVNEVQLPLVQGEGLQDPLAVLPGVLVLLVDGEDDLSKPR